MMPLILRLKRTPGIYLVGFMGSGKSTVGRLLAEKLGWRFVDLDDDIEAAQGCPISEIFARLGEPAFRRLETEALKRRVHEIQAGKPTVLALGGGAFHQPENLGLVRDNGISVWLDCPLALASARVEKETHRPLARDPVRFRELFEARRAGYALADFRIEIHSDDAAAAAAAILGLPIF